MSKVSSLEEFDKLVCKAVKKRVGYIESNDQTEFMKAVKVAIVCAWGEVVQPMLHEGESLNAQAQSAVNDLKTIGRIIDFYKD